MAQLLKKPWLVDMLKPAFETQEKYRSTTPTGEIVVTPPAKRRPFAQLDYIDTIGSPPLAIFSDKSYYVLVKFSSACIKAFEEKHKKPLSRFRGGVFQLVDYKFVFQGSDSELYQNGVTLQQQSEEESGKPGTEAADPQLQPAHKKLVKSTIRLIVEDMTHCGGEQGAHQFGQPEPLKKNPDIGIILQQIPINKKTRNLKGKGFPVAKVHKKTAKKIVSPSQKFATQAPLNHYSSDDDVQMASQSHHESAKFASQSLHETEEEPDKEMASQKHHDSEEPDELLSTQDQREPHSKSRAPKPNPEYEANPPVSQARKTKEKPERKSTQHYDDLEFSDGRGSASKPIPASTPKSKPTQSTPKASCASAKPRRSMMNYDDLDFSGGRGSTQARIPVSDVKTTSIAPRATNVKIQDEKLTKAAPSPSLPLNRHAASLPLGSPTSPLPRPLHPGWQGWTEITARMCTVPRDQRKKLDNGGCWFPPTGSQPYVSGYDEIRNQPQLVPKTYEHRQRRIRTVAPDPNPEPEPASQPTDPEDDLLAVDWSSSPERDLTKPPPNNTPPQSSLVIVSRADKSQPGQEPGGMPTSSADLPSSNPVMSVEVEDIVMADEPDMVDGKDASQAEPPVDEERDPGKEEPESDQEPKADENTAAGEEPTADDTRPGQKSAAELNTHNSRGRHNQEVVENHNQKAVEKANSAPKNRSQRAELRPPPAARRARKKAPVPDHDADLAGDDYTPPPQRGGTPPPFHMKTPSGRTNVEKYGWLVAQQVVTWEKKRNRRKLLEKLGLTDAEEGEDSADENYEDDGSNIAEPRQQTPGKAPAAPDDGDDDDLPVAPIVPLKKRKLATTAPSHASNPPTALPPSTANRLQVVIQDKETPNRPPSNPPPPPPLQTPETVPSTHFPPPLPHPPKVKATPARRFKKVLRAPTFTPTTHAPIDMAACIATTRRKFLDHPPAPAPKRPRIARPSPSDDDDDDNENIIGPYHPSSPPSPPCGAARPLYERKHPVYAGFRARAIRVGGYERLSKGQLEELERRRREFFGTHREAEGFICTAGKEVGGVERERRGGGGEEEWWKEDNTPLKGFVRRFKELKLVKKELEEE